MLDGSGASLYGHINNAAGQPPPPPPDHVLVQSFFRRLPSGLDCDCLSVWLQFPQLSSPEYFEIKLIKPQFEKFVR